jgi:hypothetical protein
MFKRWWPGVWVVLVCALGVVVVVGVWALVAVVVGMVWRVWKGWAGVAVMWLRPGGVVSIWWTLGKCWILSRGN